MSSYLTVQAYAQTTDAAQQVATLLKYVQPSFEVADTFLQSMRVSAAVPLVVPVAPLNYVCLLAVRAKLPVDISIKKDTLNNPVYSGVPSVFHLRSWQVGVLLDHLIILSSLNTDIEVALAGRRTAS